MIPLEKGKQVAMDTEQAVDLDMDMMNLNPTITYRHLLSQVPNTKNPLRVVALCDMNAFYAACERVRLGLDESIPLAVQQWNSLIAVNYPAREYGIKRMDKVNDARAKCPHLTIVHTATYKEGETVPVYRDNPDLKLHKVSLDYYRSESVKIANTLKETVTVGEVEKASVDECFIDFTAYVKEEILRMYPEFAQPPKDSTLGLDTPLPPPPSLSLAECGTVIPIDYTLEKPKSEAPKEEVEGVDNSEGEGSSRTSSIHAPLLEETKNEVKMGEDQVNSEVEGLSCVSYISEPESSSKIEDDLKTKTWHDVALYISSLLMQRCRDRVKYELGYPNTAGLSRNKFLAKLSASFKKRDSQCILRNDAIPNYLRATPFQKIRNFGGKLGNHLAKAYDVASVGDLLAVPLDDFRLKFGDGALWIYGILRGIDLSEVKEKGYAKSMGSSKNLPSPLVRYSEGHHWLLMMSSELSHRLINARAEKPGLWPKTISLFVSKGWRDRRGRQAPFPFSREISPNVICAVADKLWKELLGSEKDVREPLGFTHIGLAFHHIEVVAAGQRHINGFFKVANKAQESNSSDTVLQKRKRSVSEASRRTRSPSATARRSRSRSPSTIPAPEEIIDMTLLDMTPFTVAMSTESPITSAGKWKCPKCREEIVVDVVGDYDDLNEHLARLRMVHEDGHFAENLAASLNGTSSTTSRFTSLSASTIRSPRGSASGKSQFSGKNKNRKGKQEKILNFFERK